MNSPDNCGNICFIQITDHQVQFLTRNKILSWELSDIIKLYPPPRHRLLHPLPRFVLLVCTTVLAQRDKIVDYCQTEDLAAESNYQERRKKKEERGIINLVAIKKPQGQATV